MPEVESWPEYRHYLIKTLERFDNDIIGLGGKLDAYRQQSRDDLSRLQKEEIERLKAEVTALRIEFGMQKVKIAAIGAGASVLVSGIVSYLVKHLN